jgi:hypothetical protein
LLAVVLIAGLGVAGAAASSRRVTAGQSGNDIRRENARAGTTAWRLPQAPERAVEGYASETSVGPGQTLHLHVSTTPAARYRVQIYRIGWYGGAGGRLVACLPGCGKDEEGAERPVPPFDPSTGNLDAGWPVTDSIAVGADWVSGYYLAELVLTSGPNAASGGWIPLIVREPPARDSAILVQAPVNTWQAYNDWGGRSLYFNFSGVGDNHVSFNRPYDHDKMPTAAGNPPGNANLPQVLEFPLVRFLEREGYDVSYTTDVDVDRDPAELLAHRLVIVAGHGEYWTKTIRDALERARAAGTNLAFLGANIGFWQIRYENDRREVVEYRKATNDPEPDPAVKTTRFRTLVPPRPECELLGIQSLVEGGAQSIGIRDLAVNPAGLSDPWFTGTGFTATSVLPELVGYEWDLVTPGCSTPPLTVLFHYEGPVDSDAVRYRAPSGARIFSAGTLRYSWGLDDSTGHGDASLQQFTRNALDDLTRPAPPVSVRTRHVRRGIRILAPRHGDPRVRGVVVYRHRGTRPFAPGTPGTRRICISPRGVCVDRKPLAGVARYAAVALDRWRASAPTLSAPVQG